MRSGKSERASVRDNILFWDIWTVLDIIQRLEECQLPSSLCPISRAIKASQVIGRADPSRCRTQAPTPAVVRFKDRIGRTPCRRGGTQRTGKSLPKALRLLCPVGAQADLVKPAERSHSVLIACACGKSDVSDQHDNLRNAIIQKKARIEEINLILNRPIPKGSSSAGRRRLIEEKLHLEQAIGE